jgi:hypothetical protein
VKQEPRARFTYGRGRLNRSRLFGAALHAMQKLRALHLYLGCIFAPMLLFFTISGIWQTLGTDSSFLRWLSTIHTEARWKDGSELGSFSLRVFVIVMALSFILTTILGVIMAVKFGRNRKAAFYCLALGLVIPSVLVLFRILGPHHSMYIKHGIVVTNATPVIVPK